MERLLDMATQVADQAVVYSRDTSSDHVEFENAKLKDIDSSLNAAIGLTVVKNARLGYAYSRNVTNRQELIDRALASAADGVAVGYQMELVSGLPTPRAYDAAIEEATSTVLVAECERLCDLLPVGDGGQLDVGAGRHVHATRIINSSGTDLSARQSVSTTMAKLTYPATRAGLYRVWASKGFDTVEEGELAELRDVYMLSLPVVRPKSGHTRALFTPEAMYVLAWRLRVATNGKNVYEGVSPLKDRLGLPVVSEKLTLVDRPLDDSLPGARAFDDEGTPCAQLTLIERGRLSGFYYDRYYAWKSGAAPTGHGFRPTIADAVSPQLAHLRIEPGSEPLGSLLAAMGSGVVVAGALGAHSGNILNGDFSIGLAPGLWVEGGEVVGRLENAMVAGNVYDLLQRVVAIGDRVRYGPMAGYFPAVLFDDVCFNVG